MSSIDVRLAAHPLKGKPYDKLLFIGIDHNRVPLYKVIGSDEPPCGAKEALGRAFALYGGKCFYCPKKFKPQPLSADGAHRDHVMAESKGGSGLLHNFVIACQHCDRAKSHDHIQDFQPRAARAYFEALEAHIRDCIQDGLSRGS